MNIVIIRAFVKLREVLASHKDLARKIEQLSATQKDHAALFTIVIQDIENLAESVTREFKNLKSPRRRKARRIRTQNDPVHHQVKPNTQDRLYPCF
jgi:hypothetical protein